MMMFIKKILVLQFLLLIILNSNFGANISDEQAFNYASEFAVKINLKFDSDNQIYKTDYNEFVDGNEILAYVYKLYPQGFIVISAFDNSSPVIGFSKDHNFPEAKDLINTPIYSVVMGIALSKKYSIPNNDNLKIAITEELYGPHVYTLWGQVNCHNNQGQLINVTNYYTPNHYAAGCVAISLSTLLHYYKWPPVGEGYHEYYDGWGSSTGWYEANFGETYYKWDLMLEKYNNQISTEEQREAAGELAFHAAVALEMNFEYNGSTSNVNQIPGTGSNYFRFYSFYKEENSNVFWPRLDKNMIEANPVILSVENNSGFGHSVVCDGLWLTDDEERFYHLNMGWWGSGNGWFAIQENFNAGGYTTINGGILDFIPKPMLYDVEIPADTNMFHLNWHFTQTISANMYEVQHKINSGSWETITDDYQDTSILIVIEDILDDHFYRVRARVNEEWYPASWSNTVQLQIITEIVETSSTDLIEVYPNPFSNDLRIVNRENTQNLSIKILNMMGEQFFQSEDEQSFDELNIYAGYLDKGVYLLEVSSGSSQQVFKIIKN